MATDYHTYLKILFVGWVKGGMVAGVDPLNSREALLW